MKRNSILGTLLFILGCSPQPVPVQTPALKEIIVAPVAINDRLINHSVWSLHLPNDFEVQSQSELPDNFDLVALSSEREMAALIYTEPFKGKLEDYLSLAEKDAIEDNLHLISEKFVMWTGRRAALLEVSSEDKARLAKYWITVDSGRVVVFSCVLPVPMHEKSNKVCQDISDSVIIR